MYQHCSSRSLHIADLLDGKSIPSQTLVIRFKEAKATVSGILAKIMEALGNDEPLILTDSQGNKILDTSGTTGTLLLFSCGMFVCVNCIHFY